MTKPTKRSRYDWEAIKRDYRTGRYTLGELTDMHGASKSQISKRQAAEGWTKDLSHAVQSRTRDKVVRASLSKEALEALEGDDAAIVEEASDLNAAVVAGHRTQLTQMRGIVRAYSDMLGDQMKRGHHRGEGSQRRRSRDRREPRLRGQEPQCRHAEP